MTLEDAIKEFGSVKRISEICGISVQAVYKWGANVPLLRIYQLNEERLKLQQEAA